MGCRLESRDEHLKGLKSCNADSICVSSYYFGERRDKNVVKELLTGINDARISHHIRHKGMSVYYCKAGALKKISGLNIEIEQTGSPDSEVINKLMAWALDNKLVTSSDTIDIQSCSEAVK
jgi:hypothetical protein